MFKYNLNHKIHNSEYREVVKFAILFQSVSTSAPLLRQLSWHSEKSRGLTPVAIWVRVLVLIHSALTACGALSSVVKRPWREADHSSPYSADVKNGWSYTSTSRYVSMEWKLIKQGDRTLSLKELKFLERNYLLGLNAQKSERI
jgi:hypothetical protein